MNRLNMKTENISIGVRIYSFIHRLLGLREREQTNHTNINFFFLPTKFLQQVNLAISSSPSQYPLLIGCHPFSPTIPPTILSLKITDGSFRYASPRLWHQIPDSFRQPPQSRLDSRGEVRVSRLGGGGLNPAHGERGSASL